MPLSPTSFSAAYGNFGLVASRQIVALQSAVRFREFPPKGYGRIA